MKYYVDVTERDDSEWKMWFVCRSSDKESVKWGYAKTMEELHNLSSFWIAVYTARDKNMNPPIYFLWFSPYEGEEYRKTFCKEIGIYEEIFAV